MGKNKLIIHACGGAGINIAYYFKDSNLLKAGTGYADVEFRYLDSSQANVRKEDLENAFWEVKREELGKKGTDGSGSLRSFNAKVIKRSMEDYYKANEKIFTENNIGTYHLVMFSACGGTGSVIGPFLLSFLAQNKIPAAGVMVGDHSSTIYTNNTIKTIVGLDKMAREQKNTDGETLTISSFYFNNSHFLENQEGQKLSTYDRIAECNHYLGEMISNLSIILSGDHKNIDFQDLVNIFQIRRLDKTISGGLYGLITSVGASDVHIPTTSIPVAMVTITNDRQGDNNTLNLLHYKVGEVSKDVLAQEDVTRLPLRIGLFSNFFSTETASLLDTRKTQQEHVAKMNHNSLENLTEAAGLELQDEGGLLL